MKFFFSFVFLFKPGEISPSTDHSFFSVSCLPPQGLLGSREIIKTHIFISKMSKTNFKNLDLISFFFILSKRGGGKIKLLHYIFLDDILSFFLSNPLFVFFLYFPSCSCYVFQFNLLSSFFLSFSSPLSITLFIYWCFNPLSLAPFFACFLAHLIVCLHTCWLTYQFYTYFVR